MSRRVCLWNIDSSDEFRKLALIGGVGASMWADCVFLGVFRWGISDCEVKYTPWYGTSFEGLPATGTDGAGSFF